MHNYNLSLKSSDDVGLSYLTPSTTFLHLIFMSDYQVNKLIPLLKLLT